MLTVDIDTNSGFCAGVIRAIGKAEEFLGKNERLYSLGAIVHNDAELSRLTQMGLVTIDKDDLGEMVNAAGETLLIRLTENRLKPTLLQEVSDSISLTAPAR